MSPVKGSLCGFRPFVSRETTHSVCRRSCALATSPLGSGRRANRRQRAAEWETGKLDIDDTSTHIHAATV